ncbi:MAG: cupin domain-containing protein [Mucilaginibacter sp.]
MKNDKKPPISTGPDQGKSISVIGDTYRILITGEQTGGAFAAIDMLIPPGGGPGPHAHADFEESFYVVDGEIEVRSELGNYTAATGSYISIPKGGVIHSFKNVTSKTAHLLCTVVPAGMENFFEEIGEPVEPGHFLPIPHFDEAYVKKLQTIAEKHGQEVFPPNFLD